MANRIHGRNQILHLWDSAGTSRHVSGDLNNITLSWSRSNPETTTLGNDSIQRISGLRDATLSITAIWNSESASGINDVLDDLMSGSVVTLLRYLPGGCTTGCQFWTGCFLLSSWETAGPLDAPVGMSAEFQLASGSLSASVI